jgi:hypothetical protein
MSAVIKPTHHIDHIFDHHPTTEELVQIFDDFPETRAEYLDGLDSDTANAHLYWLYRYRGDMKRAQEYLDQVNSVSWRRSLSMTDCVTAGHQRSTGSTSP